MSILRNRMGNSSKPVTNKLLFESYSIKCGTIKKNGQGIGFGWFRHLK